MNNKKTINSLVNYFYLNIKSIFRKIINGYYLKNRAEIKKNKDILKKSRLKYKNKSDNPLVSVLIPTYNRSKLLTERTIPSVLRQTYPHFELIIIGDHCNDDTEERIEKIKDKRIIFHNLPERSKYPKKKIDRWLVAGTIPANKAIELSSGDWIAHLDDDDEFSDDHIEILLNYALKNDLEMVYGKLEREIESDEWDEFGSYPLKKGEISRMSALYSKKLKFIKYDPNSWRYYEPADWNMWRRMMEAGVKIGFIDKIVGKHYREGTQHDIYKN